MSDPANEERTYQEGSWSVSLPPHWEVYKDPECATFYADPNLGALQISSAQKDSGIVTNTDLMDFARDSVPTDIELAHVAFGNFDGLTAAYEENDIFWQKWWFRSDRLLVFATYNGPAGRTLEERVIIPKILRTLVHHR